MWKASKTINMLRSPTYTPWSRSIDGLLEIILYPFNELNLNYVLLRKFKTDPLEDIIRKYPQLAGGQ